MRTRLSLAAAAVVLATLAAGATGALIAAAVVTALAGYALRNRYAGAPPPVLDLPEPPPKQTDRAPRLEQISGQLSIGMTDGRYFHRAVRPLLLRIANSTAAAHGGPQVAEEALFPEPATSSRAPTLRELSVLVDRMEQL